MAFVGPLQGCIPGVSKLFYNGLVGRVSHEDFYGTVDPLLCSSPFVKCEVQNGKNVSAVVACEK